MTLACVWKLSQMHALDLRQIKTTYFEENSNYGRNSSEIFTYLHQGENLFESLAFAWLMWSEIEKHMPELSEMHLTILVLDQNVRLSIQNDRSNDRVNLFSFAWEGKCFSSSKIDRIFDPSNDGPL